MIRIVTQKDPFFINTFLREFDRAGINYTIYTIPNFNSGVLEGIRKSAQLYGYIGFGQLVIRYFLLLLFKPFSLKNCVAEIKLGSMTEFNNLLVEFSSDDVLLSLSAPGRIAIEECQNELVSVNVHCGKLPEYAGMMPIFWQMLDQQKSVTITFHTIEEQIDTGGILFEYEIPSNMTLYDLSVEAKKKSAQIFAKFLTAGFPSETRQIDVSSVALSKFPTSENVKQFKKLGGKLI